MNALATTSNGHRAACRAVAGQQSGGVFRSNRAQPAVGVQRESSADMQSLVGALLDSDHDMNERAARLVRAAGLSAVDFGWRSPIVDAALVMADEQCSVPLRYLSGKLNAAAIDEDRAFQLNTEASYCIEMAPVSSVLVPDLVRRVAESVRKERLAQAALRLYELMNAGAASEGIEEIIREINGHSSPFGCASAVDVADWLKDKPPEEDPVVEGLFDMADKVPIIGPSKSRKSFFVLQLALSLAAGRPSFLGWTIGRARRVLLVQMEIKESNCHRRIRSMVEAMGIDAHEVAGRMKIMNSRVAVPAFSQIELAAREFEAEVIIFDPLYKMLAGDENLAKDMKPTLAEFDRLAERTGAAVVFVHHSTKGYAGDRAARDRAAGSGVIARDFDSALFISEHRDSDEKAALFVVDTMSRNYPPRAPITVRFTDGKFEHESDVAPIERTRRNACSRPTAQPSDDAILHLLSGRPLAATEFTAAATAAGFSRVGRQAAVRRLEAEGRIEVWQTPTIPSRRYHGTPAQIAELKSGNTA